MKQKTTDYIKFPSSEMPPVAPVVPNEGRKSNIGVVTKPRLRSEEESCPFRSLIEEWLEVCEVNLSKETLEDYRAKNYKFWWWWSEHTHYAQTLGAHPCNVTTKEARAFVAYLRMPSTFRWGEKIVRGCEQLSPHSVSSYGRTVKAFFGWLERERHIENTPFNKSVQFISKKDQKKIVDRVESDDLTKIFRYLTQTDLQDTYHGCRNLAIVSLLLDSGIRKGELLNIRLCDISLEKAYVDVTGKTGERRVYFNDVCQQALSRYLIDFRYKQEKQSPIPTIHQSKNALWMTEDGFPLTDNGFASMIRQVEKSSGVGFHAHQLRHTFASWMASRVDLFTLKSMLGHASITTTERYVHDNPDITEEKYRPNSPLDHLAGQEIGLKKRRGRPRKRV